MTSSGTPLIPWFAKDYRRPDFAAVRGQVSQLAEACARAATAEEFLASLRPWNELRATLVAQLNVAEVRYSQNTEDPSAKAERQFWDDAAPLLREQDALHARMMTESPHRAAIAAVYGEQLLALKRCEATTFVPAIADAIAEEAKLSSEYVRELSKPAIVHAGKTITLSALDAFSSAADRGERLLAHQALDRFLAAQGEVFDGIYDKLVALRHQMAHALGHASYVPLGYQLMCRDYGPGEVAAFRQAILDHIVPLATALHGEQRRELGLDTLYLHDEPVWSAAGNPRPQGDARRVLASARTLFAELHPEIGELFGLLCDRELIDVEARAGKAFGGFCTRLADLRMPFIFANFNGTDGDIVVLTHESGHAFQSYASRHLEPRLEYGFPTYEACEVHSMGMELLAFPWMELFFGDDAERYRRNHLRRAITKLPYQAAIDHVQHDVYENPAWTPAARNRRWAELEAVYLPHRNYGGFYPHLATGTLWQRQRHVYIKPFYYIDYTLAQICALQIWIKATEDRAKALADYLAMCRVGGSVSFLEMLEIGGLRSPFDPACVRDVAASLRQALGV